MITVVSFGFVFSFVANALAFQLSYIRLVEWMRCVHGLVDQAIPLKCDFHLVSTIFASFSFIDMYLLIFILFSKLDFVSYQAAFYIKYVEKQLCLRSHICCIFISSDVVIYSYRKTMCIRPCWDPGVYCGLIWNLYSCQEMWCIRPCWDPGVYCGLIWNLYSCQEMWCIRPVWDSLRCI